MKEKDPREKNKKYIKSQNLGNHLHNIRVLKKPDGHLIVRYRPNGEYSDPDIYEYYIRHELWRHKGPFKPTQADKSKSKLAVTRLLLLPKNYMNSLLHKVVCTMKSDQISHVAKSDETILKLGKKLCNKHGHENDNYNDVQQKMRELARLLMELRKTLGLPNHSFAAFFHPKYYRFLETCSNNVAGFDESTN